MGHCTAAWLAYMQSGLEMMTIENKFDLGDIVYLRTDPEQYERIITRIEVSPGRLIYCTSLGDNESVQHFDFELSKEKDVLKSILGSSRDGA